MNQQYLDPKAFWLFFLNYSYGILFLFVFLLAPMMMSIAASFSVGFEFWSVGIFFVGYVLACVVWAKLSYSMYRYELKDNGFSKESGVIWKKYVTIPYNRIQNIDIHRGILTRLLGLSDLSIQTAGVSGQITSEGRLPGLSREVAEQLRDELVNRASRSQSQGL